jgi:hypothetical protein
MSEWRRLQRSVRPTLKASLLTDDARDDLDPPERGALRRRSG